MERRPDDGLAIVAAAWVAWILVAGLFACLLVLEHREVGTEAMLFSVSDCTSPAYDSTEGVPHWQWDPPGTYCVVAKSSEIDHREVFDRPRAWRWAVITTLAVTLPLLVWASVRVFRRARRDDAQTAT